MDRMKTLWGVAAATTVLALVPVFADHHEVAAAEAETPVSFNVQAQLFLRAASSAGFPIRSQTLNRREHYLSRTSLL